MSVQPQRGRRALARLLITQRPHCDTLLIRQCRLLPGCSGQDVHQWQPCSWVCLCRQCCSAVAELARRLVPVVCCLLRWLLCHYHLRFEDMSAHWAPWQVWQPSLHCLASMLHALWYVLLQCAAAEAGCRSYSATWCDLVNLVDVSVYKCRFERLPPCAEGRLCQSV